MPMNTVSPGDIVRSTDHNSIVNAISGDAGETLTVFYKGADIVSANALTLADDGNYWDITGTTNITSLSAKPTGTVVKLHFDGALTIVHDGTNLVLSGGASYLTAANDEFEFISLGSGQWRETSRSLSAVTTTVASTFGATPSLAFGTGNTAGTGTGFIRRNAVVALFDTTAARTLAFGDVGTAGTVGSASGGGGFAATWDHGHAMPGPAVVASVNNLLSVASTNGTFLWLPPYGLQVVPSTGNVVQVASTNGNLSWGALTSSATTIKYHYTQLTADTTCSSGGGLSVIPSLLTTFTPASATNTIEIEAWIVYTQGDSNSLTFAITENGTVVQQWDMTRGAAGRYVSYGKVIRANVGASSHTYGTKLASAVASVPVLGTTNDSHSVIVAKELSVG